MSENRVTPKDASEMQRIAEELKAEASGLVDNPHTEPETETERGIRLQKEAMGEVSVGSCPPPPSPAPAASPAKKPTAKKKTAKRKKTGGKTAKTAKKTAKRKHPPMPSKPLVIVDGQPAKEGTPPKAVAQIPGLPGEDAILNSISGQLAAQKRADGQWSENLRNAAAGTCRLLDAPHPATFDRETANAFWQSFFDLLTDEDVIKRVVSWRLTHDRMATPIGTFKQHVRACAARSLLEVMGS